MQVNSTQKFNHMFKKTIILSLMIGVVVLASASSGGGEKKSSSTLGFSTLKKASGFSLKAGRNYSNSLLIPSNSVIGSDNAVLTYRKGNTFFILPGHSVQKSSIKNNLNLLNLKFNLHR
jgi:hypothetical protein